LISGSIHTPFKSSFCPADIGSPTSLKSISHIVSRCPTSNPELTRRNSHSSQLFSFHELSTPTARTASYQAPVLGQNYIHNGGHSDSISGTRIGWVSKSRLFWRQIKLRSFPLPSMLAQSLIPSFLETRSSKKTQLSLFLELRAIWRKRRPSRHFLAS
jgi:hypothetical protein